MKDDQNTTLINANTYLNGDTRDFGINALSLFQFQYNNNPLYQEYCRLLSRTPEHVRSLSDIPFLPISFFKTHTVLTSPAVANDCELEFRSSGTTGMETSRHLVWSAEGYTQSLLTGFEGVLWASGRLCHTGTPSFLPRTCQCLAGAYG